MTAAAVIQRLTDRAAQQGYPQFVWWVPLVMYGTTLVAFSVAVLQRVPVGETLPAAALVALALVPWLLDAATIRVRWYVTLLVAFAPVVALVLLYPVDYDFALIGVMMLAGHFGAIESTRVSATATVLMVGTVITLGVLERLDGAAIWVTGLVLAWDIGFIMQYQQRKLDDQEQSAARQQTQALQEERQRIAREVHDVVAHSLSVTMLHLTAARRSLEEDADVDEATDALRDAEAAGRAAMAEIRSTVGLLGQGSATTGSRPAPDARDVEDLVAQFRAAGLDIGLDLHGDPAAVPANAGLGVYRIVQESLANVAKHQPHARVGVVMDLRRDAQAVQVWNTLPGPVRTGSGGTGIIGMRQRAELLAGSFSAGPRDGLWVVEARLPQRNTCRLGLPRLGRVTGEPEPA